MTDFAEGNAPPRAVRFGGLAHALGIEIIETSPERVVGTMPVNGNTRPDGRLHGGAACALAETLGTAGAQSHAGPERVATCIEINATHHRAPADGLVTAVATRIHGGRSLAGYEIVITDERLRRVCTARLTCVLRDDT